MASDALLDVMLLLPILHAIPGVRVGRSRPSSAHAVPFDAGPHPGWRSGPRNGQAQQPPEVCWGDPPSCVDVSWSLHHPFRCMGPLVSVLLRWGPRVFSSPLLLSVRSAPSIMRRR